MTDETSHDQPGLLARPMHSRQSIVKAVLVLLLAVGLLAAFAVMLIFQDGQRRAEYQEAQERALREQAQIHQIYSLLQEVHAARREYVFSGTAELLEDFEDSVEALWEAFEALRPLVSNDAQRERAALLRDLVGDRVETLEAGVAARREHGISFAFESQRTSGGQNGMAKIRDLVDEMIESDIQALDRLQITARQGRTRFQVLSIGLLGGILVLVLVGSLSGLAYLERRRSAEHGLRQAKQQAEHASEAKTEFLASMSHEIRTPLSGILGYTELLLNEDLERRQRRYVERIQVAGSSLLTVVNDILDFSSIEAGELSLELHPFSLRSLIDNIVSILATTAEKKGLTIHSDLDRRIPRTVVGDEARLRQILLNLMNNAVKFTEKGHVLLTARAEKIEQSQVTIRFAVTDTGIGIAPEKRNRLFRRFSQTDGSIRRRYGGSGLGLAISKKLVDMMDGRVGLESEPAKGSTFWFQVTLGHTAAAARAPGEPDKQRTWPKGKILLVEDLEQNQEIARTMLESAGHDVDVVADGTAAVAAVAAGTYDLVFMDIQMPGMDGMTATRRIRELAPPACDVPVIAMTANVLPQHVQEFRAAGMTDHIGKPFRRTQLLDRTGCWLRPRAGSAEGGTRMEREDGDALDELHKLMGRKWVARGLSELKVQLDTTFGQEAGTDNRDELVRRAHRLVSLSATLGFYKLSKLCSELEEAAGGGGDPGPVFAAAQQTAEGVRNRIEELLREEEAAG